MKAYLLSLNPDASIADQWDFGFLKNFLDGQMWQTADWEGFDIETVNTLPKAERALVAIPARHNAGQAHEINAELNHIDNVVLFLMGDEEADFPVEKISHPSIHIWVQNPHPSKHDAYHKIGTGYPAWLHEHVPEKQEKSVDVFFSGQLTHKRRKEMWDNLLEYKYQTDNADINGTESFTSGLEKSEYMRRLANAKVSPAPAGAVIPDSFRLYEALEMMCMVIADERNSAGTIDGYWEWVFDEEPPFYLIREYDNLVGYIHDAINRWPNNVHTQTAWWLKQKRDFAYKVMNQLRGNYDQSSKEE